MTNPTPRPALRKAADAGIHPAAPRPARSPRARTVAPAAIPEPTATPESESVTVEPAAAAPAPLTPPKKRQVDAAKPVRATKRKFSGSTSDHLRVPEVPEVTSSQRSALDHLFENDADTAKPTAKGKGAKADAPKAKAPKAPKPVDLMGGKLVDLEARVPKTMRKAARDEAKKRGLDVDTVVTDLLFAWLVGRD